MLDGHTQVVLGDLHRGDLPSLAPTLDPKRQSFCSDSEGWGPLSPTGFHLTPCFLDVIVAVVAVWGTLSGAVALYLLLKKRIPQPVSKNWHFYAKLVRRSRSGAPARDHESLTRCSLLGCYWTSDRCYRFASSLASRDPAEGLLGRLSFLVLDPDLSLARCDLCGAVL